MVDDTLFPEPVGKAAAKQKKQRALTAIDHVIGYFSQRHQERFGVQPIIRRGRDHKHVKDLLEALGEAELRQLIDLFFTTPDPKIARGDYSLGWFYAQAQYLRVQGHRTDERTMENLSAIARDVRRSRG